MTTIHLASFMTLSVLAAAPEDAEFSAPVRLEADGELIRTESPGWASPCWHDVDGDGKPDLLVGQFNDGRIKVYRTLGEGRLAAGEWLEAGGEVVEVPGVW